MLFEYSAWELKQLENHKQQIDDRLRRVGINEELLSKYRELDMPLGADVAFLRTQRLVIASAIVFVFGLLYILIGV